MKEKRENQTTVKEALDYSGVAVNDADDDKVTKKLVKEATCELNNNPRNQK